MPWLILLLLLTSLLNAAEPEGLLFDRTVRYVNDSVLSVGDVWLRNERRRAELYHRNNGMMPAEAQSVSFSQESLEELTNDELLLQEGKRLSETFKLHPVNHDQITQKIQEEAAHRNVTLTLRELADQRREREREELISFVLYSWFYERSAHVTSAEIAAAYQARLAKYSRPARIQALEIVLRPTDPAEREQAMQAKRRLFKDAQDQVDAQLRAAAESKLDAYLAATPEAQEKILDEVVAVLATNTNRAELDGKGRALAESAKAVLAQTAAFRNLAGAQQQLTTLRTTISNLAQTDVEAAFKTAAIKISQGPNAVQGGDLGWIEPAVYTAAFDEHAFACKAGELSPVFVVDQVACLVLVTAREEARIRPLEEVRGELDAALTHERQAEVKRNAIAMLRSKASIRDLTPLTDRQIMEILKLPLPR